MSAKGLIQASQVSAIILPLLEGYNLLGSIYRKLENAQIMNELIILKEQDGKTVVPARDLYDYPKPKTLFPTWCKRMFEYGFKEEQNFIPILEESTGGRPSTDYALTLDCPKKLPWCNVPKKAKLPLNTSMLMSLAFLCFKI